MNTQRKVSGVLLSCIATALMGCASVQPYDRAAFLREMARTDGNPQGDNAVPRATRSDYVKLTNEQIAFFHEMARTDGSVSPGSVETPAEPAIASR